MRSPKLKQIGCWKLPYSFQLNSFFNLNFFQVGEELDNLLAWWTFKIVFFSIICLWWDSINMQVMLWLCIWKRLAACVEKTLHFWRKNTLAKKKHYSIISYLPISCMSFTYHLTSPHNKKINLTMNYEFSLFNVNVITKTWLCTPVNNFHGKKVQYYLSVNQFFKTCFPCVTNTCYKGHSLLWIKYVNIKKTQGI